jgi:hypothetical protein
MPDKIDKYKGVVEIEIFGEQRGFKFGMAAMAQLCHLEGTNWEGVQKRFLAAEITTRRTPVVVPTASTAARHAPRWLAVQHHDAHHECAPGRSSTDRRRVVHITTRIMDARQAGPAAVDGESSTTARVPLGCAARRDLPTRTATRHATTQLQSTHRQQHRQQRGIDGRQHSR